MACKNAAARRKYMREYIREMRAERKRLGICVICGKKDSFSPFSLCPGCMERETKRYGAKKKKITRARKRIVNEIKRRSGKKRYRERKEAGYCPRCGRFKPLDGKVHCEICLLKKREQIAKREKSGA